ncbi:hypothetical protein [Arthrobacter caoxuetaonis]|uniref:Uncharacterized protein n=1 Tax=Arthrobacter caoxuetaonis TaxID=2886935 RepID=A0A9X1SE27_9MICC|nr:hypothetical protein [Arthrobacter caoxuetaonis]MCC3299472.1 hypothetical protein [Arthrobacter caoxuetaonis]USQ59036.1 hypothetical protein NF551_18190 [Arthrobacter caoxuetaonis]
MNPNRVPEGVPSGGQFAAAPHGEPIVSIAPAAGFPDIREAGQAQLRLLARSADPAVRAEVTSSPVVPDDVLEELSSHTQAPAVRLAVVNTGYAGTAERAAEDPSPIVRASALASWDLSEIGRRRLEKDPEVQRFMSLIAA